jgi:hypothetical protein
MLDDGQLDHAVASHAGWDSLARVAGWLRPVAPQLRLRALSYYLEGLAPDQLCSACRRDVDFPFTGDAVAAVACSRCAAQLLVDDLDTTDQQAVSVAREELRRRMNAEFNRSVTLRNDSARLVAQARALRHGDRR